MDNVKFKFHFDDNTSLEAIIPKIELEAMHAFTENYTLQKKLNTIEDPDLGEKKNKKKRICRFCLRTYPVVKFDMAAHVVSEQFGRTKVVSYFECDECNAKFSVFENDLSYFLLLDKVLLGVKSKKSKFPKFKSPSGTIQRIILDQTHPGYNQIISDYPEIINKDLKIIEVKGKTFSELDYKNDTLRIDEPIPPYYPLNVYRAFLKMAMCLFDEDEFDHYKSSKDLLMKTLPELNEPAIYVIRVDLPVQDMIYKVPEIYLYKKISSDNLPDKVMVLYFGNMIFQVPIYSDTNLFDYYSQKRNLKVIRTSPLVEIINPTILFSKHLTGILSKCEINKIDLSSSIRKDDDRYLKTIYWRESFI